MASGNRMIPAGYNAKFVEVPEEWLGNPRVSEILSVSECISESPIDHTHLWLCNQWLLYDSEDALSKALAKTGTDRANPRWFFYEAYEKEMDEGEWWPVEDRPTGIVEPDSGYSIRGLDIVCFNLGNGPECSPLSCNSGAKLFPVNRFCLVETLEEAVEIAWRIDADGGYEPGPYRIMSVWEKDNTE